MDRTEQFLSLFNHLEQFLREETNSKRDVPFGGLIGRASHQLAAVRHYARDLREFADLRNAIVHEHPKGRVIADITPEAFEEFERMVELITAPQLVFPLFNRKIRLFSPDDRLSDAIQELWTSGYSQIIVRADGQLSLLSNAGITRWLGSQINGSSIDLARATVEDAMAFEKDGGMVFLPKSASVFEARDLFMNFPERHKQRLRIIIVTENGKATEAPLGIITASDLVEIEG